LVSSGKNILERYKTMKNSLFKRAFATVAAVPLALSQCLTCTPYAATNDSVQSATGDTDSSKKEVYTLKDNFLYIDPAETESTWYSTINSEWVIVGNNNPVGYVKKATVANSILRNSGKYSAKAQVAVDMLSDEDIKYVVSPTGDITVTGKLVNPDLSKLTNAVKIPLDDTMKELAEKYGIPEILEADFSSVDFSGTYEIVVEGSDLALGNTMDIKAKYTANTPVNGKSVFAIGDAADFILAKFGEIQAIAYASIDSANLPADISAEAKKEFDSKFEKYLNWVVKFKNNQDKVNTVNRTASSSNFAGLVEKLNEFIKNGKYSDTIDKVENLANREFTIPATASDIMSLFYVADIYGAVIKQINKVAIDYDVQISKTDIASFVDNDLSAFEFTAKSGTYTLKGDFPDDEVADSVKHMVATVDVGDIYNADNNLATVGLRIYREPVVTTTSTSTSTTTSTTTTTATSTTDVTDDTTTSTTTDVTTSTTDVTDDTTTSTTTDVTTSTTDVTDDTTTSTTTDVTTTTDDPSSTTTTTDVTTTDDPSSTTTTDVTTTDDPSSTTTTSDTTTTASTDDPSSSTTTTSVTTVSLNGEVKNWSVSVETSTYGFYYSHDEEFNREQVAGITLHAVYTDDKTEDFDISAMYDFASTPAETFVKGDADFKYIAGLVYSGEDLVDTAGNVVLKKGDALKTINGNDAGVEVYIGLMGDVNLDYKVNAVDGSQILSFYAEVSTGVDADSTILSTSNKELVTDPTCIYDQFAAFLADVNQKKGAVENNWKTGKAGRAINAVDFSTILVYYASLTTGGTAGKDLWESVLDE